jgi:hypothetical protein
MTFKSKITFMRFFKKPLAIFLIALFLSLSFNAYACLVPIYGGMKVSQGNDCSTPAEKSASQFCDGFKSLAVQSSSDIPSGGLFHFVLAGNVPSLFSVSVPTNQFLHIPTNSFLPDSGDILVLISVFRI